MRRIVTTIRVGLLHLHKLTSGNSVLCSLCRTEL